MADTFDYDKLADAITKALSGGGGGSDKKNLFDPKQFEEFKKNNYTIYRKELWYYSESFYIKRDKFTSGISLDESIIDISRFENQRKQNEEVIIEMPGFKDVLVLLPSNKLMFKPE